MVALHDDPSRSDAIVRAADAVVAIAGPGPDALARALAAADVDALWPGWAPAAEDPTTAAICARLGVRFLGPDAEVLRRVRDRIAVKRIAEGAGLRVVPWNGEALDGADAAIEAAAALGFPVMLKAAAGGGRAGIRRVDDEAELLAVIEQAAAEAQASFGDARLYLEALLAGARHLEVTVVADRYGKVWTFGPNDATLRRRGDKVVIESAAAGLSPADIKSVRGVGGDADATHRLPRRGHGRVRPRARRRPTPLPRGLSAAATRARRHRGDDRRRPRPSAAARRARRSPRRRAT